MTEVLLPAKSTVKEAVGPVPLTAVTLPTMVTGSKRLIGWPLLALGYDVDVGVLIDFLSFLL